jgi:hypothetical protein
MHMAKPLRLKRIKYHPGMLDQLIANFHKELGHVDTQLGEEDITYNSNFNLSRFRRWRAANEAQLKEIADRLLLNPTATLATCILLLSSEDELPHNTQQPIHSTSSDAVSVIPDTEIAFDETYLDEIEDHELNERPSATSRRPQQPFLSSSEPVRYI